jgi:hypothetical protein
LVAYPVPEELRVTVRRVLHGVEPVGNEVGQHGGAIDVEERPDDPAPPPRDAGQAAGPCPLEDPHENGLDLIVGGVAERDAPRAGDPRDTPEGRVPGDSGSLFRRPSVAARHLDPDDVSGAAQPSGQRLDEARVAIRLRAKAVVDVADRELEREPGPEQDQRVKEGDRVGAARNAYEDVVAGLEETVPDDRPPKGIEQLGPR